MGNVGAAGGPAEPGPAPPVSLEIDDLEVSLQRGGPPAAPGGAAAAGHQADGVGAPQGAAGHAAPLRGSAVCREVRGPCAPLGARAFTDAGLVGTEREQLKLLSYFAMLSEDFRRYQEQVCRVPPREALAAEESLSASPGAAQALWRAALGEPLGDSGAGAEPQWPQLVLLSGPPGTGKTRHALAWSRAMGLPLVMVDHRSEGWLGRVEEAVRGRDCMLLFDELDGFFTDLADDKSEVAARFPAQFRQFLDGTLSSSGGRVLVAGTTNNVGKIPRDVVQRGEVVDFQLPSREQVEPVWSKYAGHLTPEERRALAAATAAAGLSARDVKAQGAKRHTDMRA
ncbi:unnamed protein product [Prorocentrum cordatum]|uniref:ATPase AAA-type core domain-containing protein n=1 Tax=Prorocentrum cordatum TaxID=2364126 RepID=A0ABN9T036_9DINO|nr:unnamed protein product [Polarella glacialis]